MKIWEPFSLNHNEVSYFKIGPLNLWIKRYKNEWRIVHSQGENAMENEIIVESPTLKMPPEDAIPSRFALKKTSEKVRFSPMLADRNFIIKPDTPFYIPEYDEATIWVATSLWLEIRSVQKNKKILEVPFFRPSDTWFGKSNEEGELCYFGKTTAKLRYEELNLSPHRAITKITIKNDLDTPLLLERIKLPIMNLSLYKTNNNYYYTDAVNLINENKLGPIRVRLDKPPVMPGHNYQKISKEREKINSLFFKAIHFFSNN